MLSILRAAHKMCDNAPVTTTRPAPAGPAASSVTGGVRARVRAELTAEIKGAARRQIAAEGAAALSLRAVARELGMVSSGIYRYFASRDELLTALIVDAYDALGEAGERADAACRRDDFAGRWSAACHSVRDWALANPNEYALLYGSPVPGYRAPIDTIAPATRITLVLTKVAADAAAAGELHAPALAAPARALPAALRSETRRIAEVAMPDMPEAGVVRAIAAWTQLFGYVSFELFGHLVGGVEQTGAMFDEVVTQMGEFVGLRRRAARSRRG